MHISTSCLHNLIKGSFGVLFEKACEQWKTSAYTAIIKFILTDRLQYNRKSGNVTSSIRNIPPTELLTS